MQNITTINNDNELLSVKQTINMLQEKANGLAVNCKEAEMIGTDIRNNIKKISKEVENKRKYYVEAPNDFIKQVNSIFKPILNNLENIDDFVEGKMITYHNECVAEIERLVKQKEEEFQKALNEGKAIPKDLEVKEAKKKVESNYGNKMSYTKRWTYKVVDMAKVPEEYIERIIDECKVDYAIKIGKREIPGLEIYRETGTRRY